MRKMMDGMALTECDDDIRTLTRKMPKGVLLDGMPNVRLSDGIGHTPPTKQKRLSRWSLEAELQKKRNRVVRNIDVKNMRAMTINPVAGWLILQGIKDVENRRATPIEREGTMAVTFSKIYPRGRYEEDLEWVAEMCPKKVVARVPSYEDFEPLRGKCVGVVDYVIRETSKSKWYEVAEWKAWCLSNPAWLAKPFHVLGQVGCWHLKPVDAQNVLAQLSNT